MAQQGKHSNEGSEPLSTSQTPVRATDQNQLDFELDFFGGVLTAIPITSMCCASWATC